LLPSNWLCALCFQPSGAIDQQVYFFNVENVKRLTFLQGELYGPYFVKLSEKCQPPEQLVPRALLRTTMEKEEQRASGTGGLNIDQSKVYV
jgi:hypothetical protein